MFPQGQTGCAFPLDILHIQFVPHTSDMLELFSRSSRDQNKAKNALIALHLVYFFRSLFFSFPSLQPPGPPSPLRDEISAHPRTTWQRD